MRRLLLTLSVCFLASMAFAQEFQQPSEGKSMVYFVRYNASGALVNFKYFDGEQYLGKINGRNYFAYECEPGEHLFWVASENRDFLAANLKPNAIYVLEARPTMGAFKAAVRLHPISPDDEKSIKRVTKLMSKRPAIELKGQDDDMEFFIQNSMERYEKVKAEGKLKTLNSDWTF